MKKEQVIEKLKELFPGVQYIHDGYEWGGEEYKDAIHLGDIAEGGLIDEVYAADYYGYLNDPKEKIYILGIHKKLRAALDKYGYWPEWYDAGTVLAWPK